MKRLIARAAGFSLVLLLGDVCITSAHESSPMLGDQVHAIFQSRCIDCHGADLERPKGKFGYVLDLARVAANPKMIVPGDPAKSELYQTVFHNEMPPPESKRPPLTAQEKEVIKTWIEYGALPGSPDTNSPNRQPLTLPRRIIRDLGQFHPPSAHFPIALLLVALPAEFMWMLTRNDPWKAITRFCVVLGAATAVITATLGWCDALFSTYAGASASILLWHRWVGTATAVWAALVAALSELSSRRGNSPPWCCRFRFTLVVGAILVSAAGYLGASLIYGLNHFSW